MSEAEVVYVGGNAATLLVKVDKAGLEGKDLSTAVVKGADFSDVSLSNVDFSNASLNESIFARDLGDVLSVAFSPDGKKLASGGYNQTIKLCGIPLLKNVFILYKDIVGWKKQ